MSELFWHTAKPSWEIWNNGYSYINLKSSTIQSYQSMPSPLLSNTYTEGWSLNAYFFFIDLVKRSMLVLVSKICHYRNDCYYYYVPVIWSTNKQGKSTHQSHVSCLKRSSYARAVWIFNVLKVNIYIMFRVNPVNCAWAPGKDCLICFSNEN